MFLCVLFLAFIDLSSAYYVDKKNTCPVDKFRCRQGGCVSLENLCDGKNDCFDGSDEQSCKSTTPKGICVLPPYPEHGSYTVANVKKLSGQAYTSVVLNITCNPGFDLENARDYLYCVDGFWSDEMPKCVRFCQLYKHDSVEYRCLINDFTQARECGHRELEGTIIKPMCRRPYYYYPGNLQDMKCKDGNWNYTATCKPECGNITPEGKSLVIGGGGKTAKLGELPWHAGIYTKTTTPYMQICGGSLISTKIVISAAHCFWSDVNKLLPAADFAVAVGKIFRPWNDPQDSEAQKSDVTDIKVSSYFRGSRTNYQDDIALVIVATPFTYKPFVRPVCIDFDVKFNRHQLNDTNLGKVAGWGLIAKNGPPAKVLQVLQIPFVNVDECFAILPQSFFGYITSDKICAGYTNGTALCRGDSGGGLAFPNDERGIVRYYLRGVASTAALNEDLCNLNTLTTFTQIIKHENLISESI